MKGDMEAKLREFEKIYTLTTTEKRKTDLLSKASLECLLALCVHRNYLKALLDAMGGNYANV
ncbi:hypothetical protein AAZX31_06G064000 [Glycine max]|uniref:Uncharacterized protein n=2 Tax=Glycine subgen. Soja TaxID=1462606 RepID=A0A0R0JJ84_SOYBN|nr:hypothetical protein GYH30_014285 [Glycine max]KRH52411.1 hypothetical protein GLYMA_06G066800v4 [Glycine max]RZC06126.1 hypothetical protein D0Y65_013940 [Glycine soja]